MKPVTSDTVAYVKYLDSQALVNKKAKMGVFGYCMGGPLTMQAAAANPDRSARVHPSTAADWSRTSPTARI
jgi:dienelactone hydrolase